MNIFMKKKLKLYKTKAFGRNINPHASGHKDPLTEGLQEETFSLGQIL